MRTSIICLCLTLSSCAGQLDLGMAARVQQNMPGEIRGSLSTGGPLAMVLVSSHVYGVGLEVELTSRANSGGIAVCASGGIYVPDIGDSYVDCRLSAGARANIDSNRWVNIGVAYDGQQSGANTEPFAEIGWRF